jgi:hypothetical protein
LKRALGALLLATLFARPALADKPRRDVRLSIEDCTPSVLNVHDAYSAAALELGLGDTSGTATEPNHVELDASFACDRGVKARLTLKTADQSASRVVSLDDVRVKDRPRVLALALAELVRAEWRWVTTGKGEQTEATSGDERHTSAEPARDESKTGDAAAAAATPNGASSPSDTPAANGGKPSARAPSTNAEPTSARDSVTVTGPLPEPGFSLEVLFRARELFEGPNFVYGAAVGARWHRWSAGAEALFGTERGELGTASVGLADVRIGYDVLRATRGRWFFGVEPGVAAGVTWLGGTGATPDVKVSDATAFYGDARLAARAEYRTLSLSPAVSLEAGRALGLAAQEHGTTLAVTGGWFLGGAVGVVVGGL